MTAQPELLRAIHTLIQVSEQNRMAIEMLMEKLDFEEPEDKLYLNAEEAAQRLGIRVTRANQHRRDLKKFRDLHLLTQFGRQNPYTYLATEVEELRERIRTGEISLP